MKNRMLGRPGAGFGAMSKRFDGKEDKAVSLRCLAELTGKQQQVKVSTGDAEEDAKIQAMLQQNAETWEDMAADMSTWVIKLTRADNRQARFNTRPGADRRPFKPPGAGGAQKFDHSIAPDKEPPVGYICYRCGQKGHWIQNCPSNDDPQSQNTKRFVRVTGIPRTLLKTVDSPMTGDGSSTGAMLTADGGFVMAVPDQRQWQKQAAVKTRNMDDNDDDSALPQDLTCHICKKLVRDAVRVPCCDTAFCEECIQSYLLEHDFECASCESKVASFDKLVPAEDLRERAQKYLEQRKEKEGEEEGGVKVATLFGSSSQQTEDEAPTPGGAGVPDISGKNPYSGPMPDMNTLQDYLQAMLQTLRNPIVPPQVKQELRAHIKMTNANLLQMQMLAAQGLMFGAQMGNAMMSQQMGMNMNMGMNNGMNGMGGNGMNMGMNNMGMQRPQVQPGRGGFGFRGQPGGFRGRGRGGFMPRGGAAARVPSAKRPGEDMSGGAEKMQRVA